MKEGNGAATVILYDMKETFDETQNTHSPIMLKKNTHFELPPDVDPPCVLKTKREIFIDRLASSIHTTLETAASNHSSNERDTLLAELFSNIASELEDTVQEYLHSDLIHTPYAKNKINKISKKKERYFELLAEYYVEHPEEVERMHGSFVALWCNANFPIIYSALMYKWIFAHGMDQTKNLNIFIKGANRLFWFDLETISTRFVVVYQFLKDSVLLNASLWDPDGCQGHEIILGKFFLDFFNLVSRFILYFEKTEALTPFLQRTQAILANLNVPSANKTEQGQMKFCVDDMFVQCVVRQIHLIKNESVLVRHIQKCVHFKGLNMSDATRVRLQSTFYAFAAPGGPVYAPRSVRHAAIKAVNALFPGGKLTRTTIYLIFRLLHPYYAVRSLLHWVGCFFVKPVFGAVGLSLGNEEDEL